MGAIDKALSILDNIPKVQDNEEALDLNVTSGEIEFKNVTFYYKDDEPFFENKSLRIHANEKVGLVGYSGSGKSTFVNLILRLYDVTSGSITIDGQNIKDVTQDSLRSSIGMIPQEASLFNRSMMDNIRYSRIESTDNDVVEAAKKLMHITLLFLFLKGIIP